MDSATKLDRDQRRAADGKQAATFLSREDVETLTGYRKPSAQRAWLDRNAIPYFASGSGRPIILREALHDRTIRSNGPQTHPRLRLAAPAVSARR